MKLILSVNDLEAGVYKHRFTKRQREELFSLAEHNGLLPLDNSLPLGGGIISVIQVMEFNLGITLDELVFRPFWNRCFLVVDCKYNNLNGLVLETKEGQMLFQPKSESSFKCTTHGEGTGRQADIEAQMMLARIMKTHKGDPCLFRLLRFASTLAPKPATTK